MKKLIIITLLIVSIFHLNGYAQEKFGRAFNIGVGAGGYSGYYGYVGRIVPVLSMNYEFDVARNFTLAPFVAFYSFSRNYYHETVIPIGVKGTYYFDELFRAHSDWDFYAAGSLGYSIINSRWDESYPGPYDQYHHPGSLFLDLHIGAEYHFNNTVGAFLDLSTGVSTIGLAFHGNK